MFSSYHFRTDRVDTVAERVQDLLRGQAWLSQAAQGWVSLYDAWLDRPDRDEMHRFASAASKRLEGPVLALFVKPSDLFLYVLYDGGAEVDAFASSPLDGDLDGAWRGRAQALLRYVREGVSLETLEAVLHGGPPPGMGMTPEHVDAMRQQIKSRLPELGSPAALQKMLQMAAEQMRNVPPAMMEGFMRGMGIPPQHPALAALRADPTAFLRQMASDPDAIRQFADNVTRGFDSPVPSMLRPEEQAVALAHALGIEPGRAQLSFPAVGGVGGSDAFRLLGNR